MFEFKNPISIAMIVVGAVLLLAAVAVNRFVPLPTVQQAVLAKRRQEDDIKKAVAQANVDVLTNHASSQPKLWQESDDRIAPEALSHVTSLALANKVKVTAFRPQKDLVAGTLAILPLFLTIQGPFPNVMSFERDLEDKEPLLAVNLLQVASADSSSNQVTATIGLSAYLHPTTTQANMNAAKEGDRSRASTGGQSKPTAGGGQAKPSTGPQVSVTTKSANGAAETKQTPAAGRRT